MLLLTLLWCLEVVKSSFQPFPSDFEGVFVFYTPGDCVENEDPGRNFVLLKIVRGRVVSYAPLVSRSR